MRAVGSVGAGMRAVGSGQAGMQAGGSAGAGMRAAGSAGMMARVRVMASARAMGGVFHSPVLPRNARPIAFETRACSVVGDECQSRFIFCRSEM